MSAFGDNNFKSDIYENLSWMVSNSRIEQLKFIHNNCMNLIENGMEYLNDYIKDYANDWNLSEEEIKMELGEVYSYILAYRTNDI